MNGPHALAASLATSALTRHGLAYALGLGLTLILAAYLTPRRWWRRPTARGLLILAGGTWGTGGLLLAAMNAPAAGMAVAADTPAAAYSVPAPAPAPDAGAAPRAGQRYRVHRDVNLRAQAGVAAPLIGVVPAGADVTPTGQRQGDWWQIEAGLGGRARLGWASSLWLRQSASGAGTGPAAPRPAPQPAPQP